MLHRLLTAFAVSLLLPGAATAAPGTTPQQAIRDNTPHVVAFTSARIIVSPDKVIENGTLVARDGRIESVGAGVTIPKDAVTIDASGLTIYPGFVEPYSEYGLGKVGDLNAKNQGDTAKLEGTRVGANAWNDAIHAEIDWVDRFQPDTVAAKALLERGYTVAQSAKMDGVFRGRGFVASLRDGLPNDLVVAPRTRQFASFDKGSSQQEYPSSLMGSIALIRQTLLDAGWYASAQAAYSKNRNQAPPETNLALAAIAAYEGPIIFETGDELSLLRAAKIGAEFGRPMIQLGSHREANRLAEIAALKQTIILPVSLPRHPNLAVEGSELETSLGQLRAWERAPCSAATLESRGISIAFTSWKMGETEEFFANIRDMIKCGLSKKAALAALTTVPAGVAGIGADAGTLEPGKRANLVLAKGDLLERGSSIEAVWVDGRLTDDVVADLRGKYDAKAGDQTWRLEIAGSRKAPSVKLGSGEKKIDATGVERSFFALTFAAALDDLGTPGAGRFRLTDSKGTITGTVALADGRTLPITLVPVKDSADEKQDRKDDDQKLISRLTYPNIAFGWEQLPKRENVLVRNATIWTSDAAGILQNADLLVLDGKIAKVGSGLSAPAGTRVIDATGKHVTPGIVDEHSHLAISQGVNEGSHAITAEVRIGDVVNSDDVGIYRALGGGVTMAHLLHGSANAIGGQAQVIKLRWGLGPEQLMFDGAQPSIKFALGENPRAVNWGDEYRMRYPQTRMGVEAIIRDRFFAAREYEKEWKAWNALPKAQRDKLVPPRRDLQLEAIAEVIDGKRGVTSHSYVQSEILMLMRLAEDFGFRVRTFTHVLEGYKVAPELVRHGASAAGFSDWWAYKFEVYDAIPYSPCLMNQRGVLTAINSDSSEAIRRLNQEAAKSVMYCGMDQATALKMVTINPAIALRADKRVGSLTPGKDADFVIWNGNPLSMYSKAEQTWIDGTNYFDLARDAAMRKRDAEEKAALTQKVLASKDKRGGAVAKSAEMDGWECDDVEDVWHAGN